MLRRHFLLSAAAGRNYLVYCGTYTAGGPRYGTGESKGLYVSRLNTATGQLTPPQLAAEAANPSYLAVHPNRKFLYSIKEHIEMDGKIPGEVSAFAINPDSRQLSLINRVPSRGGMPCHLGVANWATGSLASFPVRPDGSLGESTGFYQHFAEGTAPVHSHAVVFSPDNRFLIETDTALSSIFVHRLNPAKATIVPPVPPTLRLNDPVSPRHLVFHPNGRWAYVANESGPGCTMLDYDRRAGTFKPRAITRTVPDSYTGRAAPAEAVMHPQRQLRPHLQPRPRIHRAVLRINPADGTGARSFNVDPTGQWLFALMRRSNQIHPLRFDTATGKLSRQSGPIALPAPVCAKFV